MSDRRTEIDRSVIERAASDPAAFGEIYDHYVARVYGFCRYQVETREEAEDLTSLTFERAFVAIPRYVDRGGPFSFWLLRIAHNAIRDRGRKSGRSVRELHDDDAMIKAAWRPEWDEALWLRSHINALPPDQCEVVKLRFYDDFTFREIGDRMGRTEGAVKQLLRRALTALFVSIDIEDRK